MQIGCAGFALTVDSGRGSLYLCFHLMFCFFVCFVILILELVCSAPGGCAIWRPSTAIHVWHAVSSVPLLHLYSSGRFSITAAGMFVVQYSSLPRHWHILLAA